MPIDDPHGPGIEAPFESLARLMEEGIPFNRHLGLKVARLIAGECVLCIPWFDALIGDPEPPAIHGGVTSMLLDTSGGAAVFTRTNTPRDRVSTVDLRVDYLRPGPKADLYCHARVVRVGNRVAVARMQIFGGELPAPDSEAWQAPFATGQGVYNVVRH